MASLASVFVQIWVQAVFACILGAFFVWMFLLQRLNIVERGAMAHWSARPREKKKRDKSGDVSKCKDFKVEDIDLDGLFDRLYWYFIHKGFLYLVATELVELLKYCFMMGLGFFLMQCVDLDLIPWKNKEASNKWTLWTRPSILTAIIPLQECISDSLTGWEAVGVFAATGYFLYLLTRNVYHFLLCWELRRYYADVLAIDDDAIDLMTWQEVMIRIREAAETEQICVGKKDLTELDIYNIILRRKNYLISVMDLISSESSYHLPIVGSVVFASETLYGYIDLVLFGIPWLPYNDAPFKHGRFLREKYMERAKRKQAVEHLKKRIMWFAMVSVVMAPFMFFYRVWDMICQYFESMKRAPGDLWGRLWSPYARCNCRHINELHHELNYRLNSSSPAASTYMTSFVRRSTGFAKFVAYVLTAILGVLIALVLYDEVFVNIGGVVTLMSTCGTMLALIRGILPNPNYIYNPEKHMRSIVKNLHYVPIFFLERARAGFVKHEFALLYETRWWKMFYELFSPVFTPIYLIFEVYPQAGHIVRFLAENTERVDGLGDMCTMSRFNLGENGSPLWQVPGYEVTHEEYNGPNYRLGADGGGRVELSLLRFAAANPKWVPNGAQRKFLLSVERAMKELKQGTLQARQRVQGGEDKIFQRKSSSSSPSSPLNRDPAAIQSLVHQLESFNGKQVIVGNQTFLLTLKRLTKPLAIEDSRDSPCRRRASVCDLTVIDDAPSRGDSALNSAYTQRPPSTVIQTKKFFPDFEVRMWPGRPSDSSPSSPDVLYSGTSQPGRENRSSESSPPSDLFQGSSAFESEGSSSPLSPADHPALLGAAGDISASTPAPQSLNFQRLGARTSPGLLRRNQATSPMSRDQGSSPGFRPKGGVKFQLNDDSPPSSRRLSATSKMIKSRRKTGPTGSLTMDVTNLPSNSDSSTPLMSSDAQTDPGNLSSPTETRRHTGTVYTDEETPLHQPHSVRFAVGRNEPSLETADIKRKVRQRRQTGPVGTLTLDLQMLSSDDSSDGLRRDSRNVFSVSPGGKGKATFMPFGVPSTTQIQLNEEAAVPETPTEQPPRARFAVPDEQETQPTQEPQGKAPKKPKARFADEEAEHEELDPKKPKGRFAVEDAEEEELKPTLPPKRQKPKGTPTGVRFALEGSQPALEEADTARRARQRRQTGPVGTLSIDLNMLSTDESSDERRDSRYVFATPPGGKGKAILMPFGAPSVQEGEEDQDDGDSNGEGRKTKPSVSVFSSDEEVSRVQSILTGYMSDDEGDRQTQNSVVEILPIPKRLPKARFSDEGDHGEQEAPEVPGRPGNPSKPSSVRFAVNEQQPALEEAGVARKARQRRQTGPVGTLSMNLDLISSDSSNDERRDSRDIFTETPEGGKGKTGVMSSLFTPEEETHPENGKAPAKKPRFATEDEEKHTGKSSPPSKPPAGVRFAMEGEQPSLENADMERKVRQRRQTGPVGTLSLDLDMISSDSDNQGRRNSRNIFSGKPAHSNGKTGAISSIITPGQDETEQPAEEGSVQPKKRPKARFASDEEPSQTPAKVPQQPTGVRFAVKGDQPSLEDADLARKVRQRRQTGPVGTLALDLDMISSDSGNEERRDSRNIFGGKGPIFSSDDQQGETVENSRQVQENAQPQDQTAVTSQAQEEPSHVRPGTPSVRFALEGDQPSLEDADRGRKSRQRRKTGPVGTLSMNMDLISSEEEDDRRDSRYMFISTPTGKSGLTPSDSPQTSETQEPAKKVKPKGKIAFAEDTTATVEAPDRTRDDIRRSKSSLDFRGTDEPSQKKSKGKSNHPEGGKGAGPSVRFTGDIVERDPAPGVGNHQKRRRQTGPVGSLSLDLTQISSASSESGSPPPAAFPDQEDMLHGVQDDRRSSAVQLFTAGRPMESQAASSSTAEDGPRSAGVGFEPHQTYNELRSHEARASEETGMGRATGQVGSLALNTEETTTETQPSSLADPEDRAPPRGVRFGVDDDGHLTREAEEGADAGDQSLKTPRTLRFAEDESDEHPTRETETVAAIHKRRPTGPVGSLQFNMADITSSDSSAQATDAPFSIKFTDDTEEQRQGDNTEAVDSPVLGIPVPIGPLNLVPDDRSRQPSASAPPPPPLPPLPPTLFDLPEERLKRRITIRRPTASVASLKIDLAQLHLSESEPSPPAPPTRMTRLTSIAGDAQRSRTASVAASQGRASLIPQQGRGSVRETRTGSVRDTRTGSVRDTRTGSVREPRTGSVREPRTGSVAVQAGRPVVRSGSVTPQARRSQGRPGSMISQRQSVGRTGSTASQRRSQTGAVQPTPFYALSSSSDSFDSSASPHVKKPSLSRFGQGESDESPRPPTLPPPPRVSVSAAGRPILNLSDISTPTPGTSTAAEDDDDDDELFGGRVRLTQSPINKGSIIRPSFVPLVRWDQQQPGSRYPPGPPRATLQSRFSTSTTDDDLPSPLSESKKAGLLGSSSATSSPGKGEGKPEIKEIFKPFQPLLRKSHKADAAGAKRDVNFTANDETPVGPDSSKSSGRTVRFAPEPQRSRRESRGSAAIKQRRPTGAAMGLFRVLMPGSTSSSSSSPAATDREGVPEPEDAGFESPIIPLLGPTASSANFREELKRRPTIAFRGRQAWSDTDTDSGGKSKMPQPVKRPPEPPQTGKAGGKRRKTFFFPKAGSAKEDEEEDFEAEPEEWKFGFDRDTVGEAVLFLYEIYARNARGVDEPINVEAIEVDAFGARSRRADPGGRTVVPTNEMIEMDA